MAHGPDTQLLLWRLADCINEDLTTLNLAFLNITSLPPLPDHVLALHCHHTSLKVLPYLPEGLIVLYCYNTPLTSLPTLPDTLMNLNCSHTRITSLPKLPKHLMTLWCNNTLLTTVPELPVTITYFDTYESPLILRRGDDEDLITYNLRWREWREDQASKPRVQERTLLLKEELMMEAWHPDRVERWLEAGVELDCM